MPAKKEIDFTNFENVIKTVIPEYTDLTAGMSGRVSNFAQKQFSDIMNEKDSIRINGNTPVDAYFLAKGSHASIK